MLRNGGQWKHPKKGTTIGEGMAFHFRKFQEIIFGAAKIWHAWNNLQMECFLKYRSIGVIGPASSGKTNSGATDALSFWYVWPECTTVLCCSTTRERLEDRVWGEIKKYHRIAKARVGWLPGNLIEGRQRIVMDPKGETTEGRDFRNGLIGVPCKKGTDFVGISDYAGIKNKNVILLGDELSLLPRAFVDATSNLDKNPVFKLVGLGNPKETTDALGVLCEPAPHLGGWEGGLDQRPGTKTWETRRPQGVCIQFPGDDSPNLDGKMPIPLITQEQIDRDIAFYGKDSLWYTMMDLGRMPRGQGSRRVITRQMCLKHRAMEEAVWGGSQQTTIGALDAAYRGVGGDRCVLMFLKFGKEAESQNPVQTMTALMQQNPDWDDRRQVISVLETIIVPVNPGTDITPEDQITAFCRDQCVARGVPPENFFYDAGMRTSLVQSFSRIWSPGVESIDFGGRPSEGNVSSDIKVSCRDYYSKFVTELWFNVRLVIECFQMRGMNEDLVTEGSSREWKMVGANKIEVETKEDMKKKIGRSPDLFDALAIGIYGATKRGFSIRRVTAKANNGKRDQWGKDWRDRLKEKASNLWKGGTLETEAA